MYEMEMSSLKEALKTAEVEEEWEEKIEEIQKSVQKQEEKFFEIQGVAPVSSVQDIGEYYMYLQANSKLLNANVKVSLDKIEELSRERSVLQKELQILCLTQDLGGQKSEGQVQFEYVMQQDKQLREAETKLASREKQIEKICYFIQRISSQLYRRNTDVTVSNVEDYLAGIENQLDGLMNIINMRKPILGTESINKSLKYIRPPKFLQLNPLVLLTEGSTFDDRDVQDQIKAEFQLDRVVSAMNRLEA